MNVAFRPVSASLSLSLSLSLWRYVARWREKQTEARRVGLRFAIFSGNGNSR